MVGEARNAIAALFGGLRTLKHVWVYDEDVDIRDETQVDWAFGTRFQADQDIVMLTGIMGMPMDPSLQGRRTGAKAGFDLTLPFGQRHRVDMTVSVPPKPEDVTARFQTVEEALTDGSKSFGALVGALGSDDGREVVLALDSLRHEGRLAREEDGRYILTDSSQ